MKNLVTLVILTFAVLQFSCTKEGPAGPQGASGPQGPAGTAGATGPLALLTYSILPGF